MKQLNVFNKQSCAGLILKTNSYGDFKVLDVSKNKFLIEFVDTGYRKWVGESCARKGVIKDPYRPTIFGVGFTGKKYPMSFKVDGKCVNTPEYERWRGMLRRCYSEAERHKNPTYKGCTVSDNFKSYEFFYEWYNKQVGCDQGWCLDKDLLAKGNKQYREDLCILLPYEINNVLTKTNRLRGKHPIGVHWCNTKKVFVAQVNRGGGKQDYFGQYSTPEEAFQAYKVAKEDYLKELAEKWKGKIDDRAYQAMLNYEVEITD